MAARTLAAPRKWLRFTLIAIAVLALVALVVGSLHEASTHVVRGWLRGEAFYDGRPTSYWRERCDEWLERFDDANSMKQCVWLIPFELPGDSRLRRFGLEDDLNLDGWTLRGPAETYWKRTIDHFRSKEELDRETLYNFSPQILWATPDTQPVLEQLIAEEKYHLLATVALRRVQRFRAVQAREAAEAKEGKQ